MFSELPTLYLETYLDLLPRSIHLNLHVSFPVFEEIRSLLLQNVEPLQLRNLNIKVSPCHSPLQSTDPIPYEFPFKLTDMAYLRELEFHGLSLPCTTQSHQNLTRLSIKDPHVLPSTAQVLTLLSHCPALKELAISLTDRENTTKIGVLDGLHSLDFHYLTRVELCSRGVTSYECVRDISSNLRIHGQLSFFRMNYDSLKQPEARELSQTHIFELAPTRIWSHFANADFLSIDLNSQKSSFKIRAGYESEIPTPITYGFSLTGYSHLGRLFDQSSAIIDLCHKLPKIRRLRLFPEAMELFTFWNIEFLTSLPHLTTVELTEETYLDSQDPAVDHKILAILRERGVEVIDFQPRWYIVYT